MAITIMTRAVLGGIIATTLFGVSALLAQASPYAASMRLSATR